MMVASDGRNVFQRADFETSRGSPEATFRGDDRTARGGLEEVTQLDVAEVLGSESMLRVITAAGMGAR
jgi:hypothetical protein